MKKTILALVIGAALGALVVPVAAQGARGVVGAWLSHVSEERVDISVGVSRSGDYARADLLVTFRDTVVIPEHYGRLVSVTAEGEAAVLWFLGEGGSIRNVILPDGMERGYRIEKNGSQVHADIRKPF